MTVTHANQEACCSNTYLQKNKKEIISGPDQVLKVFIEDVHLKLFNWPDYEKQFFSKATKQFKN